MQSDPWARPQQPGSPKPPRRPKLLPLAAALAQVPAASRAPPGGSAEAALRPSRGPISPPFSAVADPQVGGAPVRMSTLSHDAPEFYPLDEADSGYEDPSEFRGALTEYAQEVLNHLTQQPASFDTEVEHFTDTLNGLVTTEETLKDLVELIYQHTTTVPHFSYLGARLCNHLAQHLALKPQSGHFRQLLLKRCQSDYETKDQAAKGDEGTRKRLHSFVLFLGELYLNLEIRATQGKTQRIYILQVALRKLLNVLFSNPVDSNLICAVKVLKMTGAALEEAWKEQGLTEMEEMIEIIENVVIDADCSREVKKMLLKLVELRSSNWGRVHDISAYREATPENDPDYFMNEPTFYTEDGIPFTAADPDFEEKYQDLLNRDYFFPDDEEDETDLSQAGDTYWDDTDDDMDSEIEEAYEKFWIELKHLSKQLS